MSGYRYKIALPCPSIYGQFNNLDNVNYILNGLYAMGFDHVEEVSVGCEYVAEATRAYLTRPDIEKPVINSSCPALIKLLQLRFEPLLANLLPAKAPEEVTATLALKHAYALGYKREDIGVFVISPCSAKMEAFAGHPDIDGVLAMSEVYFPLVAAMNAEKDATARAACGRVGLNWSVSGGEAAAVGTQGQYLAADGIENVMSVLNALDHGQLSNVEYMELRLCPSGCTGGVLNPENPFLAAARIRALKYTRPITLNYMTREECEALTCVSAYPPLRVFTLSTDRAEAMRKLATLSDILAALPGIDCGSCGAPSCRAFAEDVVNGKAEGSRCKIGG
jgi:iron only hydrogenase large subunit-like protein